MNNDKRYPALRYVAGYGFLFFGLVAGFLPILQGWIFVAIGLLLLRDERWARKVQIWVRRRYPESRPVFRKVYKSLDGWIEKWWGRD